MWRSPSSASAVFGLLLLASSSSSAAELVRGPVVGIDLGTTYSCVGIYKNGQVEIIPNDQGNRITPSVVAFADEERLVGEAAKNQAVLNPTQTFFDVKRLIGRPFSDPALRKVTDSLPFQVVDKGDKPSLVVSVKGEEKRFEPEQISALVLGKLKQIAEQHLGAEVKHAVVTVPASFNNAQRQATKDAGRIAGLEVLQVLNEPTAAAVAYGLEKEKPRTVLVYDLGGGTFDVTILKIEKDVFKVLATSGDTRLGGEDFDQNIVQYLLKTFEKKHEKSGVSADPAAVQKLRREAEKSKRMLSSTPQARFSIEALFEGEKFAGTLTRARFEEMNADLFKRTISLVQKALQDAGLKKSEIDDIVLVGGSTRIPKIQQLVKDFFDGKEATRGINPDEAVAYGAAIQAGSLSATSGDSSGALLLDVSPLTLGIETVGGVMTPIIARNSLLPARNSTVFTTHRDNQPALDIQVFEGERLLTRSNHRLGKFRLSGLSPSPRGEAQIEVSFEVDVNGILTVSAEDRSTGRNESLVVSGGDTNRLSADRIEGMLREAEEFAEEDRQARERADARTALDSFLLSVRAFVDGQAGPSEEERQRLQTALLDGKDWLATHLDATVDEVRAKHEELESLCGEVTAQYGFGGGGHAPVPPSAGADAVDDDMEGHDEL